MLKEGGVEDNVSASSSFIANAHNELDAFYTEIGGLFKKKSEPIGERPPPPSPKSATAPATFGLKCQRIKMPV